MIPPLIVSEALSKGIHLIAISDHNATANVNAVMKAALGSNLTVLPGIEIQTKEEVHVLCLFDTLEQLEHTQTYVTENIPALKNDPNIFGEQFVVDETGEFIRREEQLLITSVNISIEELFTFINKVGGLAIPAHVDRSAFGLLANLGFVPSGIQVEALEISRNLNPADIPTKFPQLSGFPIIQGGDASRLNEILGANLFTINEPTLAEIVMALRKENGRSVDVRPWKVDKTHIWA